MGTMAGKPEIKNIKELAQLAGASVGSTSMVMGGKWEKKVNPKTAAKILRLAEEYNYKINPLGRSLQLKQYLRIAIIMEGSFGAHPLLKTFSFHDSIGIIADLLNKNGYSLDIFQLDKDKTARIITSGIFPEANDAVIFLEWKADRLSKLLAATSFQQPYIIIGDDMRDAAINYVYRATEDTACNAVNHFIANGHRRIGISRVAGSEQRFSRKLAGYKTALKNAQIEFSPELVVTLNEKSHSLAHGTELAKQYLSLPAPPTAYFCDDNIDALGMLIEFQKRGFNIPGDIEIIGYGDSAIADISTIPISYLKIPSAEMAAFATTYILEAIRAGKNSVAPVQRQFPEILILRDSTRQ